MEVHLTPDLQTQLERLAAETRLAKDELVREAMAGYFAELTQAQEMLDRRHDDVKSGRVKPVDGEDAFAQLRRKSEARFGGRD